MDSMMIARQIPPGELKPYEENAKIHPPEQIERIAESIKAFGWKQPIVVDRDNTIIIGHGRYYAALELRCKTVPVVVADDLTTEQCAALRLADNKTNESDWDLDKVQEEVARLNIVGVDMTRFGFEDLERELATETYEEPETPEMPEEPQAKTGDVWKLGRHRLYCGDSRKREDIEILMNGEHAQLLLTDPPYGISVVESVPGEKLGTVGHGKPITLGTVHRSGKNRIIQEAKRYHPVIGDETTDTARENYLIAKEYTDNQIIFGGNYFTDFLPPRRCWIVWDKQNTGSFADVELAWTSFEKGARIYHFMWNGICRQGSREVEGKTRVHPTQKPVGMLTGIIEDFSQENDIIVDCFGGSGSTLIACEQTGRTCYMMEMDPHYIDVIIQRWETLTGEKAVLMDGSEAIPDPAH